MRRAAVFAAALAAFAALGTAAEAQQSYHVNGPLPLRLNVRPRDWLQPGNSVQPYSQVNPASGYGQTVSYLLDPPYGRGHIVGTENLADPVNNGPFPGARNPIGPVDINGFLMGAPPLN